MIKLAVFSDTHGNAQAMEWICEAVDRLKPDALIHLGDCDRDTAPLRERFPDLPLHAVCGNCDLVPLTPARLTVQLGPVKAFLTHGHLYNVTANQADSLVYAAQEEGARIAFFGHTHVPCNEQVGGVWLINPGTAGKGSSLSFAVVTVLDNGAVSCDIRPLPYAP